MKDPAVYGRIFHFKYDPGYKIQDALSNLKVSSKIKSSTQYPVSSIRHLVSCIPHLVSCIPHLASRIQKLIPLKNSISGFGNYK